MEQAANYITGFFLVGWASLVFFVGVQSFIVSVKQQFSGRTYSPEEEK